MERGLRGDFRVGDWLVEPSLNHLSRGDLVQRVRPRLIELLVFLAQNAGEVVTKDQILDQVWHRRFVAESVLTRSVADLRQLLGDEAEQPRFIETIPKRGYRLVADVSWIVPAATAASRNVVAVSGASTVVLPFVETAAGHDTHLRGASETRSALGEVRETSSSSRRSGARSPPASRPTACRSSTRRSGREATMRTSG